MYRLVSKIVLMLILTGMFTAAFNVQPVKVNASSRDMCAGAADSHGTPGLFGSQSTVDLTDSWPVFRHDASHTGTSYSPAPSSDNLLWEGWIQDGDVVSPIVVLGIPVIGQIGPGGVVYLGDAEGNVWCMDANTGEVLWTFKTGGRVDAMGFFDGQLFVGSADGNFYCVDPTDGEVNWRIKKYSGSPLTYGDALNLDPDGYFLGSVDGRIYRLDPGEADWSWFFPTEDEVWDTPCFAGGLVYAGSNDHKVYCLNAITGSLVWSYTTGNSVKSSPSFAGGVVYVGSDDGNVYALDATNGALVWSYTTGGNVSSSPAVADGRVYVGSFDHKVYALNASSGALVWSYTTGGPVESSPADVGDFVYVGSDDGKIYVFGASVVGVFDVAVANVVSSKTVVGEGFSVTINFTVANQGSYTGTFNATAYANATIIGSENATLPSGNFMTVTFTWNTAGFAKGNYTLSAYAEPVPGETDTADNNCTGGTITVTIAGDVTGEGVCDMQDISIMIDNFMATPPNWNPNCDVNNDLTIDMADISIAIDHFMQP